MFEKKYKEKILEFSLRLNEAQRPIQILDAVKWNDEVLDDVIKSKYKNLPKIDQNYYQSRPLKYDPLKKLDELKNIREDIKSTFHKSDEIAQILIRNTVQYEKVIEMLMNRGTKKFYQLSKELYGSSHEHLNDHQTKLYELAPVLSQILSALPQNSLGMKDHQRLTSEEVVDHLKKRLGKFFDGEKIKVKLADGIVSDASAGSDYIKIKSHTEFTMRDVRVFEVHEGWVHLGTTINGDVQEYAKWLSKGPPCATVTQEGLAVFIELVSFALYPKRAKKLTDRLSVCKLAEEGGSFLDAIEYYRLQGLSEAECLKNASRAFRGGDVKGGAPFTKDLSYLKGFVEVYNLIRTAFKNEQSEIIPFLFAGKATAQDAHILYEAHLDGLVEFPKYLPPQISDINGLAVMMAFSNFFNQIELKDANTTSTKIKIVA